MNYIVKPSDTLISIAEKFGVKLDELIKENNLDYIYKLIPGLELIIPKNNNIEELNEEEKIENNMFSYYIVEKGDNLYQIGKRYGISPQILADINGIDVNSIIYPNEQIMVPREDIGMYITKENDTFNDVINSLGIDHDKILEENKNIYLKPDQIITYKKES